MKKTFLLACFVVLILIIAGDIVLIMWNGVSDTGTIPYAVDTFIIRNDRIQRQTCRLGFIPK